MKSKSKNKKKTTNYLVLKQNILALKQDLKRNTNFLNFRIDSLENELHDFKNEFLKFKDQVLKTLDWLVGAFKKFDEEHTVLTGKYSEVNGKLTDHEVRINNLEKKPSYQ